MATSHYNATPVYGWHALSHIFSTDEIRDLPIVISAPRFATYLRATSGDREQALALYLWNLSISAALMIPLQICEVSTRNAVVEAIEKVHGANWPWNIGFRRSLPRPKTKKTYDAAADLIFQSTKLPTAGKVVAELKFAFWEAMFTVGQESRLWNRHFRDAFPGAPALTPISQAREHAGKSIAAIRSLRNRIAHHEPIFTRDIALEYQRIHELVQWRSPTAADWMARIQTVTSLIPAKP